MLGLTGARISSLRWPLLPHILSNENDGQLNCKSITEMLFDTKSGHQGQSEAEQTNSQQRQREWLGRVTQRREKSSRQPVSVPLPPLACNDGIAGNSR